MINYSAIRLLLIITLLTINISLKGQYWVLFDKSFPVPLGKYETRNECNNAKTNYEKNSKEKLNNAYNMLNSMKQDMQAQTGLYTPAPKNSMININCECVEMTENEYAETLKNENQEKNIINHLKEIREIYDDNRTDSKVLLNSMSNPKQTFVNGNEYVMIKLNSQLKTNEKTEIHKILNEEINFDDEVIDEIEMTAIGIYKGNNVYKKGDTIINSYDGSKYILYEQAVTGDNSFNYTLNENLKKGTFIISKNVRGQQKLIGYITTESPIPNLSLYGSIKEYAKESIGHIFHEKLSNIIGYYKHVPVYLRNEIVYIDSEQYILSKQKKQSELKVPSIPDDIDATIIHVKENNTNFSLDDIKGYVYNDGKLKFIEINRGRCSETEYQKQINELNGYAILPPFIPQVECSLPETSTPPTLTKSVLKGSVELVNKITNTLFTAKSLLASPLVTLVNEACDSALKHHLIEYPFSLFRIILEQDIIAEKAEKALLRIMRLLPPNFYPDFFQLLETNKNYYLRRLIKTIDDASINPNDENNYTLFIKELVNMFKLYYGNKLNEVYIETDHVFFITPIDFQSNTPIFSDIFKLEMPLNRLRHRGAYDEKTGQIQVMMEEEIFNLNKFNDHSGNNSTFVKVPNSSVIELRPLQPIIVFASNTKLPLVETAIRGIQDSKNIFLIPAIFFKYYNDKQRNKDIGTTIKLIAEIGMMIPPGVQIIKTSSIVLRLFASSKLALSILKIGVITEEIRDPFLVRSIEIFDKIMTLINIAEVGGEIITDYTTIGNNLKKATLLNKDKDILSLISEYKKIINFIDYDTLKAEVRNIIKMRNEIILEISICFSEKTIENIDKRINPSPHK